MRGAPSSRFRIRSRRPRVGLSTLAACAVTAAALSACGSSSGGAGNNKGIPGSGNQGSKPIVSSNGSGSVKIGVVIKGLDNTYFQTMEQGVKAAAAADHVSVTIEAAQSITDTTGQAADLSAMANQNFACYVVNPISGTNLVQGIAKIAAHKTPIVNIDSPVDTAAAKAANAKLQTYIGTDNVAAGEMAGREMKKALPQGGQVAVIAGVAGDVTSQARVSGFEKAIGGSSIKVVSDVNANWERQQAFTAATTALNAHTHLAGFFVANDDMALGVARAVQNAHKTGTVKVVSVDGIVQNLRAIKQGLTTATVSQYPWVIGKEGVEACEAAIKHKTLPAKVATPIVLVTHATAGKALAKFPEPFVHYVDPFRALLSH